VPTVGPLPPPLISRGHNPHENAREKGLSSAYTRAALGACGFTYPHSSTALLTTLEASLRREATGREATYREDRY